MYVVLIERALHPVMVIGGDKFAHLEDAENWARATLRFPHVWRVAKVEPPEAYQP